MRRPIDRIEVPVGGEYKLCDGTVMICEADEGPVSISYCYDCPLMFDKRKQEYGMRCTEETIRVVDRISLEIEEAKKDHEKTYKSIGDAILKCGNMRVLKKEYPEAYKVLEAYDTESPKSKTNTALQLPLESINKILSKYEKDN